MKLLKKINFFVSSALVLLTAVSPVYCLPQDEQVVSGSAQFDRSTANTLNVNTPSDKLIVNYSGFDIAQAETVNFNQPSSSSVALNRVTGGNPSAIFGALRANGQIFVVNPNGIMFGPNSRVDVAGLVASTLDISNEDFLSGKYNFFKNGENAYIINQGNISIGNGGYACLLSAGIDNKGTIQAELGTAVLASGEKITLALDDLNDISVVVDEGVRNQVFGPDNKNILDAVKNSGTISANGGKVILTAKVLNKVFDYAINNTGIIEANDVVNNNGVIEFVAEGAPLINTGSLEAGEVNISAPTADVISTGILIAKALIERGASFLVGGVFEADSTNIENLDNAVTLTTGHYGSVSDNGDIIVASGATITLSSDAIFWADSNTNGSGAFIMNSGSSIAGNSKNLTIKASEDSALRTINLTGNKKLTLSESKSGSTPVFTAYNAITLVKDLTINSGVTLNLNGQNLDVSGSLTNNGTLAFTFSGITAQNKTYDGTTSATLNGTASLVGTVKIGGSYRTLTGTSGAFTDKDAGDNKTVTISGLAISGSSIGSCKFNPLTPITANIYKRNLTVTASAEDKVYDGTRDADVTLHDNRICGDSLTDSDTSALFNTKDAGDHKLVTVSGIHISGHDADNYCLTSTTATDYANIDKRNLTVTASASDKVYDGTRDADVTLHDNRICGDSLADDYTSALFNNKNAGDYKLVTVSGISISGHDAGNYRLTNTTATDHADIDKRSLTVTASASDKVYDGTRDADVTLSDNRVEGDILTDSYTTALFDDKNVGEDKLVTVSGISISGHDADNYYLTNAIEHHYYYYCGHDYDRIATDYADITPKDVTVTADSMSKTYGDTITFNGTEFSILGLIDSDSVDSVTLTSAGAAAGAGVAGSPYAITPSEAIGSGLGNYTISYVDGALTVNPKGLTVSAIAEDKAYDGNRDATVSLSSDDRVGEDEVSITYSTALFDTKYVGTDKPVSVSGISISGSDAGNYNLLNDTASTTADIVPGGFFDLRNLQQQKFMMPELEKIVPYQIHTFDMISSYDSAGSTYAYHPLTETDMSAFDEFNMEEGAYEFIGGDINIRGHEGLLPLLEGVKKHKKI